MLNEDRGDTLYVGAPASDQRGRLYDKQRESREPEWERCWRYEVQYRRDAAVSAVRSIAGTLDTGEATAALVHRWFTDRGIAPRYQPVVGSELAPPTRRSPDDARWLTWARKCVQPTARKLVARYGWRFVAEACVGRIATVEDWETMLRDWECELQELDEAH
jgi:hypothetical protein